MSFYAFIRRVHPFGHSFGSHGHRGSGLIFAASLVEKIFAAIICIALAALASAVATDWIGKRYGRKYERAIALLIFVAVFILLGLAAARFL